MFFYFLLNTLVIAIGTLIPKKAKIRVISNTTVVVPVQSILLFILLLIFLGLRGEFTEDHKNYSAFFRNVCTSVSFKEIFTRTFTMENGFVLLNKLISYLSHSELFFHLVLSFCILCFFFHVFATKSRILWLTVLLFVNLGDYFGAMNLTRQVFAASLLFCGCNLIIERKWWKYFALILLATSIHTTSLVMIPACFLLVQKRNIIWNSIYFSAILILLFLLGPLVNFVGTIIPKYQNYHYGMGAGSINAIWAILAIYLFAIISIRFFIVDYESDDIFNIVLLNGTFLCLVFLILGIKIYMFTRFAYFFRPFACLLIPNLLSQFKDKNTKTLFIVIIAVFCVLYTHISLSGTGYDPYYFYSSGK